jgi:hypothetical protein
MVETRQMMGGISEHLVENLIAEGQLVSVKLGRRIMVTVESIHSCIEANARPVDPEVRAAAARLLEGAGPPSPEVLRIVGAILGEALRRREAA